MPLKSGMTLSEITDYLQKDLKQSVLNDVTPCLGTSTSPEGLFAVPRLVLSYVDFLGALYHGYQGRVAGERRKFADHLYAKTFLADIFGQGDANYKRFGGLLWDIYRNGTIHLYEPMKLQNQGREITWAVHKGPRTYTVTVRGPNGIQTWTQVHLIPYQYEPDKWAQPVSIFCLHQDLLNSIDEYTKEINMTPQLALNFRQTADALQTPENTHLVWW